MFKKNTNGSLKHTLENMQARYTPNVVALARTVNASLSATVEITLNPATSMIEVYAIAKDVYLKWGTADVTASNFDEVIPTGQIREFLVPDAITAVNLIERQAGATVIVIEK